MRMKPKKNPYASLKAQRFDGSPGRARTYNPSVNSRMLCHWATEEYLFCLLSFENMDIIALNTANVNPYFKILLRKFILPVNTKPLSFCFNFQKFMVYCL